MGNFIQTSSKDPIVDILYRISILFLFLIGTQAWFTWNLPNLLIYGLISIISILYKNANGIKIPKKISVGFILMFVAWEYLNWSWKFLATIMFILQFFPLIVVYYDKKSKETIRFVIKWFSILLVPGIILHIFSVCGVLTDGPIITNDAADTYKFNNFIFLITRVNGMTERFGAFCLEPSYLGTACAFLLYLVRYEFKSWYTRIILLSLILSFSLAGILISVAGYFLVNAATKKSLRNILIGIMVFGGIVIFFQSYNGGNNIVNEKIMQRLELDDKKGIKGNNRVSWTTDLYFLKLLSDPKALWTGYGSDFVNFINHGRTGQGDFGSQIRGAGYMVFVIYNGFIGLILVAGYYIAFAIRSPEENRRYIWCFFILIVLTAVQACYPFSYSWLIPYIGGSKFIMSDKHPAA